VARGPKALPYLSLPGGRSQTYQPCPLPPVPPTTEHFRNEAYSRKEADVTDVTQTCFCKLHDQHEHCRDQPRVLTDRFGNELVTLFPCDCHNKETE
jgi:hypothetical protein